MHISQSGFILRPYELSDSGHVVEVINADARQSLGYRRALVDAVGNVRLIRHVPPFAEKVVALDGDGQVSGYAYLADREQSIIYETGGAVHPAYYNVCTQKLSGNGAWGRIGFPDTKLPEAPDEL
jgi:cephalosporin-C deacetylase-like acetyl esterase